MYTGPLLTQLLFGIFTPQKLTECARIDKVKRQARKEAWYDKPGEKPTLNPFKRSRTTQWTGGSRELLTDDNPDLENGLRAPNTHPSRGDGSPQYAGATDKDMLNGTEDVNERTSDPSSETVVPSHSTTSNTARPPSAELKARRRFMTRFLKRGGDSEAQENGNPMRTDTEKSGKQSLKHPKFTVGNQLRGTLFNSWINILILCAPVGIIINYLNVAPVSGCVLETWSLRSNEFSRLRFSWSTS